MTKGQYIVTGDADDLYGWSPESLCAALETPLAEYDIAVVCNPRQSGGGGLFLTNVDYEEGDRIRATVEKIVEHIIEG